MAVSLLQIGCIKVSRWSVDRKRRFFQAITEMASSTVLGLLKKAALLDFGIQGLGFLAATALRTEKFYDLAGSGTVLLLAYKTLQWGDAKFTRQFVSTGCASVWAARCAITCC